VDLHKAIQYAQLVDAAYAVPPANTANAAGQVINASLGTTSTAYDVITTLYANDLATDINPLRGTTPVSIGLILQAAATGEAVIALRGTEGIHEWLHDAAFLLVKCPFLPGAGSTEDGFTAMYGSLTTGVAAGSPTVAQALTGLPWKTPVSAITICGHSLGGALATLLALDVAANTPFQHPVVYTYASPRTGDPLFVSTYDQVVPQTFRIANRLDLVPKLPLPPLYGHVLGLYELNPIKLGIPPTFLVKFDIPCEHFLSSYLHLLSQRAGGAVLPLEAGCVPP
jgi:Lipase (class 3)